MIRTLQDSILRIPPRREGDDHPEGTPTRAARQDDAPDRDPAALSAALREATVSAHRALNAGIGDAAKSRLTAQIDAIARGFLALGLDDLARFAEALRRKVEAGE